MKEEGLQEPANKLIHIGKPIEMDDELIREPLQRLDAAYRVEAGTMKELVAEIDPPYPPQIPVKLILASPLEVSGLVFCAVILSDRRKSQIFEGSRRIFAPI